MAEIFDLYGARQPGLAEKLDELSRVLGVSWVEHESDYRGVYFAAPALRFGGGEFMLQANDLRDQDGTYLQDPRFPEHRVLLYASQCGRPDEVKERMAELPKWEFLRRRTFD